MNNWRELVTLMEEPLSIYHYLLQTLVKGVPFLFCVFSGHFKTFFFDFGPLGCLRTFNVMLFLVNKDFLLCHDDIPHLLFHLSISSVVLPPQSLPSSSTQMV